MKDETAEKLGGKQLTEEELDALYIYLDMNMDSMTDEEKLVWIQVLSNTDKDFYED